MRNRILKFRVSNLEERIIKMKAKKAGLSISEYLRRLGLDNEIRARLKPEEVECYKTLIKFKINFKNISNLFKLGDTTGVKEKSVETAELIKNHLNKFK